MITLEQYGDRTGRVVRVFFMQRDFLSQTLPCSTFGAYYRGVLRSLIL